MTSQSNATIEVQREEKILSFESLLSFLQDVRNDFMNKVQIAAEKPRVINIAEPLSDGKGGFLKGGRIKGSTEFEDLLTSDREHATDAKGNKLVDDNGLFIAKKKEKVINPDIENLQTAMKFNLKKKISPYSIPEKLTLLGDIFNTEPSSRFEEKEQPFIFRWVLSSVIDSLTVHLGGGDSEHSRAETLAEEVSVDSLNSLKDIMLNTEIRKDYIERQGPDGEKDYNAILDIVERALAPTYVQGMAGDALTEVLEATGGSDIPVHPK